MYYVSIKQSNKGTRSISVNNPVPLNSSNFKQHNMDVATNLVVKSF